VIDNLRRSPATLTIALLWAVLYAAMLGHQGAFHPSWNPLLFGAVEVPTAHLFGAASRAALLNGQVWRMVTSTFIHLSILHLALNLLGLVALGTAIENWYGSAQFLAFYLLLGALGNTLAWLGRPDTGAIVGGGGSTVLFGMIGLAAIAGLRSEAPEDRKLFSRALAILVVNGLIGLAIPVIDNYAHLGGTVIGAVLGFGDRLWLRLAERRFMRWVGLGVSLLFVACAGAQARAARIELARARAHNRALAAAGRRVVEARETLSALQQLRQLYDFAYLRGVHPRQDQLPIVGTLRSDALSLILPGYTVQAITGFRPVPTVDQIHRDLATVLDILERSRDTLGTGPNATAYDRILDLGRAALVQPPRRVQVQELETRIPPLHEQAGRALKTAEQAYLALLSQTS
jgi:membrane associated rhomboid family serine protease